MKLKAMILGSALATSTLMAQGLYVGGDLGSVFTKSKLSEELKTGTTQESYQNSKSSSALSYGVHVGYIFSPLHRAYVAYTRDKGKLEGEEIAERFKSQKYYLGYDFTPEIAPTLRGILGVYAGKNRLKVDGESLSDALYGAKVGLLREVDARSDVELSLRYDISKFKESYSETQGAITAHHRNELTQNSLTIYVGYSYKF